MRFLMILVVLSLLSSCVPMIENETYYTGKVSKIEIHIPSGTYHVEIFKDGETLLSGDYETTFDELSLDVIFKRSGDYDLRIYGDDFQGTFKLHVEPIPWLVFIWMVADNSLEGQDAEDLSEMVPSKYVAVHVVRDSEVDQYIILSDEGSIVEDLEDVNGGSGKELRNFLEDFSSIDSIHKMVVIWDHGLAWIGDSRYETEIVGVDEKDEDALTISELGKAFEGLRFDILGFDACYMGSIEVIYELKNSASFMVASPGPEPWRGWDYSFLERVKSDTDPIELSRSILESFEDIYRNDPNVPDLSGLFLYRARNAENFVEVLNSTDIDTLISSLSSSSPTVIYSSGDSRILVDAKSIFSKDLKDLIENTIIDGVRISGDVSLSIYFPNESGMEYMADYRTLRFSSETVWTQVLKELWGD